MGDYQFSVEMAVRDYECDMQGIVNNSVYQNYLEHARHEFLKQIGIDFADYTRQGINLVVTRAELDYKQPLASGDCFRVGLNMGRESRLKFVFDQEIIRLGDDRSVLKARIIGTAINGQGRPQMPPALDELLGA